MGKKTKQGKGRLDKYYHLAKEQGFRSRAAFKLIQLNRKFNFLANARAVLDLCAAPGGWLQVCAKALPITSLILGVDLVPIKPIKGVKTFIGDITTQECRAAIKKHASGSKMDVVLHDGAPNVGGAWATEAYSQSALVLESLRLATDVLAPKGAFITKVFRSKDYNALLYALNQLFEKVEATKPSASRNTSAEIFVVCLGYKAPAKIDPRLLDPRHLFQEVIDAPKNMGPDALLRQTAKQARHREGYADGLSTTAKTASALAFIASDSPVEMLGACTKLALEGPDSLVAPGVDEPKELAEKVRTHTATTREIATLLSDLQVLGRSEFKALLKWRMAVRKSMKAELGDDGKDAKGGKDVKKAAAEEGEGEEEEKDPEALLLKEMEDIKEGMEKRLKKEKKKKRELKKKSKVRAAQASAGGEGAAAEDDSAEPMFTLKSLKSRGALDAVAEASALGAREMEEIDADSEDDALAAAGASGSEDSDDERLRYEMEMEEALDEAYSSYLQRRGVREQRAAEKRKRLGMEGELDDEEEEEDAASGSEEEEQSEEDEDHDAGGLLVKLDQGRAGVAKSGAAMAAQWFKQDLFKDASLGAEDDSDADERPRKQPASAAAAAAKKAANGTLQNISKAEAKALVAKAAKAAEGSGSDDDSDDEGGRRERKRSSLGAGPGPASAHGFEVVPQANSASGSDSESDSEDEFDALDANGKAEVLALAKKMLRRKDKESIIDAAYNRYAFHDTGLPRWFSEDERRHMRPIQQVTKAEVEAEKARLRAIDARPIKKVTEAKARKAKRMAAKLDQARQRAESIANQEDVPMNSKMREIEKVYAKARAQGAKAKGKGKARKGPPLDRRMKKELRAKKRIAKRDGKKVGGGNRKK